MAELTCPTCGRVGRVTQSYALVGGKGLPGAVIDRLDGLDPTGCADCRKTLNEAGYTVGVFGPGGTIRPEKTA